MSWLFQDSKESKQLSEEQIQPIIKKMYEFLSPETSEEKLPRCGTHIGVVYVLEELLKVTKNQTDEFRTWIEREIRNTGGDKCLQSLYNDLLSKIG